MLEVFRRSRHEVSPSGTPWLINFCTKVAYEIAKLVKIGILP
jgi:hypothetical protein